VTLLCKLLVGQSSTAALSAFCLHVGRQLVRLAEKATASLMLRSLALVVRHVFRVVVSPLDLSCCSAMGEPVNIEDISWTEMLAEGEREVTENEIAVLEAECGPFQPADGEG
jgi:hypothetical protein